MYWDSCICIPIYDPCNLLVRSFLFHPNPSGKWPWLGSSHLQMSPGGHKSVWDRLGGKYRELVEWCRDQSRDQSKARKVEVSVTAALPIFNPLSLPRYSLVGPLRLAPAKSPAVVLLDHLSSGALIGGDLWDGLPHRMQHILWWHGCMDGRRGFYNVGLSGKTSRLNLKVSCSPFVCLPNIENAADFLKNPFFL